ncbi:MAG TPA: S46 family peptidase [Thermoanaerobaculia bacterium]|nr:S46 family peptidase [Thermoanaerobaculia bacterium]
MKRPLALLAAILLASTLHAVEGKWTPQQVLQLDRAWLKKLGLELPPERLWDPKRGTGLLAGTVNVGGCSGGFISPEGLFITNHHCLFGLLQEHSTPQNDIITNGYVASSRAGELRGKSLRLTIPRTFTDVTQQVLAAVPAGADDAQRQRAIEKKGNELVEACEKRPATRCRVAAFDGGVQYVLVDAQEISDVRLVYAPPRAVGEYGGEIDNWMWPRHTGDFAIGRAYVDDAPLKTEFHFPLSTRGIKPGEFVMVLGYPGTTYRSLIAPEMEERRDLFFTRRRDVFGEWIRILEESTKESEEGRIAVADNLKTLLNRFKNAEGQLAGFRRGSIVEKQRAADEAVLAWAKARPEHAAAAEAYRGLVANIEEQKKTFDRDFLLTNVSPTSLSPVPMGPKALYFATAVARSAVERRKPDSEREPLYMERNLPRVRERMEREQKNLFLPADRRMLEAVVRRALALPPSQRIAAIDRAFGSGDAAAAIERMYAETKIFDLAERLKMLGESPEQLRSRHDPLVDLGFALEEDLRDLQQRRDRWEGTGSRLRPLWRRAVAAHAGRPIAPDANSTLRVSFAHVKGYRPRDGVFYVPQTTLSGVIEKHTGEEPFDVPDPILAAAAKKEYGPWKDAALDDVPVNFLADADTTGGNSGSPVVNGRGEVVGVNFDRVWENVANDFGYNPEIARNISVDIRYLLWLLDRVENADSLLRELGIRK